MAIKKSAVDPGRVMARQAPLVPNGPYRRSSLPAKARAIKARADEERALKEYGAELTAEFGKTVVPAVLRRLEAGATALPPEELVRRMLAVAPAPAPVNRMAEQVGPDYFDTAGVSVVLAQPGAAPISKQAVEHRRRRRTLLALRTSDNRWIYPTWQFQGQGVLPGLAEVLAVFAGHPAWSVATWLTTPRAELDGHSGAQWLHAGRDQAPLLRLARRTAQRWAA